MNGYDQSIADVLRTTVNDAQELVRSEIALAKAELRGEVRSIGAGAAAYAASAMAALIGLVFLLTAVAWAVPVIFEWPVWSGFALVGAVVLLAALGLMLVGKSRFNGQRHMPLTSDTMKENLQWMRARTS